MTEFVKFQTMVVNSNDIIQLYNLTENNYEEFYRNYMTYGISSCHKVELVADLIKKGDIVVCVCPIDAAAPKGRLILPQQQVIRELIDNGAVAIVCQVPELRSVVERVGKANIRFVITDSQAFKEVNEILDKDIELTSFSIVFARQKGDLKTLCEGAKAIKNLQDGDKVLIAEGCTHRRQCGDIGTEKIPRLLKKFTGKNLELSFASGGDFPINEVLPKLVIHCGGCMLTRRAVMSRLSRCVEANIPIVNYGMAIAYMNGILDRTMEIFK
jgi:[FeFe] hydrogenase H-cluster maturation GTPase HydF